MYHFNSG